jgi:acetamidase/formamidase
MATHYFPLDQVHFTWDTGHAPGLTVADGDIVVFETRDVSDNQIGPDSDASVIAGLDWGRVYPLAGPIQVEGAAPGDTLAVEIIDLRTRGWGWTAILPASGCCPRTSPTPICGSSTSPTASSPSSATTRRSRSPRSWARWASAPPAPPSRR